MKIGIVSNLSDDMSFLQNSITRYCSEQNILPDITVYNSGEQFLNASPKPPNQIVFWDTDEEDTTTCIDNIQKAREADERCITVLSTTSSHHAIDAYRTRVFDYLLKPYTYERFSETMDSCKNLLSRLTDICNYIIVKESRKQIRILLSDIIFTDYYNHYVQIHTPERVIRSYLSFPEFSAMLLKYPRFLCCYRNCIVNMDHVTGIDNTDFLMDSGERLPMARRIRSTLRQAFSDYTFQKNSTLHLAPYPTQE